MHAFHRYHRVVPAARHRHGRALGRRRDNYPAKPILLIVPFPPEVPRTLGAARGREDGASLGKAIVVANRPGAGGNIGMEVGARLRPTATRWCWRPLEI
jgi:tripartite-type tricarboxylate transporter receptor subunit TctC